MNMVHISSAVNYFKNDISITIDILGVQTFTFKYIVKTI